MSRRQSVIPWAITAHRTVTNVTGVDTTPPATDHADWATSGKHPIIRVYASIAFTAGSSPNADIGCYVRRLDSGGTYRIARAPNPDARWQSGTLNFAGDDEVAFDILTDSDDFLVLVEAVNGSPSAYTIAFRTSPR